MHVNGMDAIGNDFFFFFNVMIQALLLYQDSRDDKSVLKETLWGRYFCFFSFVCFFLKILSRQQQFCAVEINLQRGYGGVSCSDWEIGLTLLIGKRIYAKTRLAFT